MVNIGVKSHVQVIDEGNDGVAYSWRTTLLDKCFEVAQGMGPPEMRTKVDELKGENLLESFGPFGADI
jgi:hypothetical protein